MNSDRQLPPSLARLFPVNGSEVRAVLWAFLYIFTLLLAYYVLRPIRDELGVAGGVRQLPWLFTGTLLTMLVVSPLFSYAVKRYSRKTFITLSYRFFTANLGGFVLLLAFAPQEWQVWIGRAFFIWASVFNLFVVSVFWSAAVDVFNAEQSKRLFGLLSAGATLGGLAGSLATSFLVAPLGQVGLLCISMVLLEIALFCARNFLKTQRTLPAQHEQDKVIGGGLFDGMKHTFRSPYLLGIAGFILCYSLTSTILYFQQAEIASTAFADRAERTAFFAQIDVWVNGLTLLCQLFITGSVMKRLGLGITLLLLPLISLVGFAALSAYPILAVFVVVQVVRRTANFAFSRPAREVLFTAVSREDRYKSKNFIDTVVYRSGDQIGSWGYAGLLALGLSLSSIATLAVPFCAAWIGLCLWLGKAQQQRLKAGIPPHI